MKPPTLAQVCRAGKQGKSNLCLTTCKTNTRGGEPGVLFSSYRAPRSPQAFGLVVKATKHLCFN